MMPWCMNFPFKKIKILVPPQPHIWPKVSLVSPFSVSLVNNTRKRNLHTQKKFAHAKEICTRKRNLHLRNWSQLESKSILLTIVTIPRKKRKRKKKQKKKKKHVPKAKSFLLIIHSSIHPRTYLPTNRTRSSVCCHFHPLTWWMKIYVYARNISSTILGGGVW